MMAEEFPLRLTEARFHPEYIDQIRRRHYDEGEKKLMLAILQEALNDFVKYLPSKYADGQARFREVEEWFLDSDGEWLFSFSNIAETLGISASYLVNGLMRLKREKSGVWNGAEATIKRFRIGRTAYRTRYTGNARCRAYGRGAPSRQEQRVALR